MTVFKKIRLISWITKAFLSKHGRLIIGAFLIGIIGFSIISRLIIPYLPRPKRHDRIAIIGKSDFNNLPEKILKLLSLGLTVINEDGSPAPGLAKNWQISDDGLNYTFTLADDLFWQDETPIKAEEIVYDFSDVEREIVNEKTIKFKLKEAFSPFPAILSKPIFKEEYLGIGPYKIKRFKRRGNFIEKIILTSEEKDITFRFYPTEEAAFLGFKLGEVDILDNLLVNQIETEWQNNIQIEEKVVYDRYLGLFFNTENSFLNDKSIRQALAYAIKDKSEEDKRAVGPISPQSWAYNSEVKFYDYDNEKAKELLGENSQEEEIKISTTGPFLEKAEQVKQSWTENLGLKVNIEIVNVLSQDYQVFLGIQEIPSDPDQYVLWHSTRAENITHLKSPKIDKLLEDGRKVADLEERKEKYFDFQKFLSEESPVVFLSYPSIYKIKRKKLFSSF